MNKKYRCERCENEKTKSIFHKYTPFLVLTRKSKETNKDWWIFNTEERLIILCPKCYKKFKKEFMKGEQR